jgi:hypothetical protein
VVDTGEESMSKRQTGETKNKDRGEESAGRINVKKQGRGKGERS